LWTRKATNELVTFPVHKPQFRDNKFHCQIDMGTAEPAVLSMDMGMTDLDTAEPAVPGSMDVGMTDLDMTEPAIGSVDVGTTSKTDPAVQPPFPTAHLEIKHMVHYYNVVSSLTYIDASNAIPEMNLLPHDQWEKFCFVVIRNVPKDLEHPLYFEIMVKSPDLLTACKAVIGKVKGISWTAIPLKVGCGDFCLCCEKY
jgi:hypothetical protein